MSDFDKEAEREKLREKYEQDEEKRKTTEQMSELLLKGATMTNAHCGDCGDPIFRYDGQEFCPTCQKPVDRGTEGEATDDAADGEDAADAGASAGANGSTGNENIEVASPSDDATVQFGAGDDATEPAAASDDTVDDAPEQSAPDQPAPEQPAPSQTGTRRQATGNADDVRQVPSAEPGTPSSADSTAATSPDQSAQQASTSSAPSTGSQTGGSAADHLAQAQLTLAETIERHARLAAAADSPRETRDHLETARVAAETLDATDY